MAALARGQSATLVSIKDFEIHQTPLAEDYTLFQWLNDGQVERDLKSFFWRISTKTNFDQDVSDAIKSRFYLSEFRFEQRQAGGLGLAWLLDTTAVSLPSETYWRQTHIRVRHTWLENEGTDRAEDIDVLNVSEMTHVTVIFDEMAGKAQEALKEQPASLAERKADCFPHLTFGLDVDTQIAKLSVEILCMATAKLIVLDGAARNWRRERTKEPTLPKVHSEGETTVQQYGEKREFRNASGERNIFNLHAMIGSGYRIYFRIDKQNKSLEIGYIGKHLPTMKFH